MAENKSKEIFKLWERIHKQKRAIGNRDKSIEKLEERVGNYKTTTNQLCTQRNEAQKEVLKLRLEVAELKRGI